MIVTRQESEEKGRGAWHRRGIALLPLLLAALPALAAEPAGLAITADRLDMDGIKQVAVFEGHVDASEGAMRLQADRMTVRYVSEKDKTGQERAVVREVLAEGNVRLDQDLYKGRGDKATFNAPNRTLRLMGGKTPAVVEKKSGDRLEGAELLLVLTPDRRVEKVTAQGGGSGRVSARFTPSGEGDKGR